MHDNHQSTVGEFCRQLMTDAPRSSVEDIVSQCLDKWRIHHTRAKVDDLRETLNVIGRRDIIQVGTVLRRIAMLIIIAQLCVILCSLFFFGHPLFGVLLPNKSPSDFGGNMSPTCKLSFKSYDP